jgi:phosphohistidine phosphatase
VDLFILRHGKAEEGGPGLNDADRKLTKKGREEMAAVARWMDEQGIHVDLIASSPFTRAQETAEIVARALGARERLVSWEMLAPNGDPGAVCRHVSRWRNGGAILLVGHEPLLSSLIGRIIAGDTNAGIAMTKGALAKIRHFSCTGRPSGELLWLLTAKQMAGAK